MEQRRNQRLTVLQDHARTKANRLMPHINDELNTRTVGVECTVRDCGFYEDFPTRSNKLNELDKYGNMWALTNAILAIANHILKFNQEGESMGEIKHNSYVFTRNYQQVKRSN